MNHSDILQFEAAVICNPGVETPKHRKTPRKIPGISNSPDRGYQVTDRKALGGGTGSLYAMLMMGQLRHCFEINPKTGKPKLAQRQQEGYLWAACSLTYWEQQLGLTRNEVRAGVACLEKSDLVVIKPFRWGNNDVDHYRLTEKALGGCVLCTHLDTEVSGQCVQSTHPVCNTHTLCATHTPTSLKCDFEVDLEVKDTHAKTQPEMLPGGKESGNIENLPPSLEVVPPPPQSPPAPVPVEKLTDIQRAALVFSAKIKPAPSPQPPAESSVPDIATEDVTEPAQAAVDVPSLDVKTDALRCEDEPEHTWQETLDEMRRQGLLAYEKAHPKKPKNLTAHA